MFLRVRIFVVFTLLLLVLVVPVVGVLLWHVSLLLLALLWPESCDVLLRGSVVCILLFIDDIDHSPFLFVCFDPVVGEEGVVGVVDHHPSLILVREQLSYVFWGSCSEDLGEEKFAVGFDAVVGEGREHVLSVGTLWLNWCRTFGFDSVRSVIFVERIEQFLQSGHEFSRVFTWFVCKISESIDDEFVV